MKHHVYVYFILFSCIFLRPLLGARNPFSFNEVIREKSSKKVPILRGLSSCNGKRLALLDYDQNIQVVGQGEKIAQWDIEKIGENYVVLSQDTNRDNKMILEV